MFGDRNMAKESSKKNTFLEKIWVPIIVALIGALGVITATVLGGGLSKSASTPIPTPVLTQGPFSYQVQVQARDTGEFISDARVTVQVGGPAPLDGITDANGVARIFIGPLYEGQPGCLIVEAPGYQRYRQNIDLVKGTLPYVVQLEKLLVSKNPTAVTSPTDTVTPSTLVSPSPVLTITPSIPLTDTVTPSPMPSDTPTPTPEAVVISATGLNLRSGPGTNYDPPIDYLSSGEILDVIGRIPSNEWVQVVPVSSTNTITGWVSASPKYVQLNVDLNTIPIVEPPPPPTPTSSPAEDIGETVYQYEYGPILDEPKPGSVYSPGDIVRFTWERFNLKPGQYYSVRVSLDDAKPEDACIHIQTQESEALLKLDCPVGAYYWSVVVATKLPEGSEHEWREDSKSNHKNHFGIGMPHPGVPTPTPSHDSGGGGSVPGG
jgi:hypothetical protein